MKDPLAGRIALREMLESDIPLCFQHQLDPKAGRMAAFTSKDGKDPDAYMARWSRLLQEKQVEARMILLDSDVVGTIGCWGPIDERQVTSWIWKEHWGKGIATAALSAFLRIVTTRPLYGSAAHDNAGSIRVLEKCGFKFLRKERGFAAARGAETDEVVFKLG
jgi:RimJ/RimL family protein N-acetyltransferase